MHITEILISSIMLAYLYAFTIDYRIVQNFDGESLTKLNFDESSMSETLTSKTLTK